MFNNSAGPCERSSIPQGWSSTSPIKNRRHGIAPVCFKAARTASHQKRRLPCSALKREGVSSKELSPSCSSLRFAVVRKVPCRLGCSCLASSQRCVATWLSSALACVVHSRRLKARLFSYSTGDRYPVELHLASAVCPLSCNWLPSS